MADAKHLILVLDDDAAVRESLKFVLGAEGFEVRTYSDGNELLNGDEMPFLSCLIVDYHMPQMNGLELVATLRRRNISIPAILITGRQSKEMCDRAAAAGVPIVEKPFVGSRLIDSIWEAFARSVGSSE